MSLLIEFIPNLFVALAFDFILYKTGAVILKSFSAGFIKHKNLNYNEFKALKNKSNKGFFNEYVVGVLFYMVVISSIAWLN
jgi:hypothetical protein